MTWQNVSQHNFTLQRSFSPPTTHCWRKRPCITRTSCPLDEALLPSDPSGLMHKLFWRFDSSLVRFDYRKQARLHLLIGWWISISSVCLYINSSYVCKPFHQEQAQEHFFCRCQRSKWEDPCRFAGRFTRDGFIGNSPIPNILIPENLLHPLKPTYRLKIGHPKRNLLFQPSIFRCELLVSGRVKRCKKKTLAGWFRNE